MALSPNASQQLQALEQMREELGTCADPIRGRRIREEILKLERDLRDAGVNPDADA